MSKKSEEHDHAEVSGDSDGEDSRKPFEHFLENPAYLSSAIRRQILQHRLKMLPEAAQKRVKALKNIQLDYLKLETKFFEEVYQIERKYQELYQPLNDKRKSIINGEYEPTDSEAESQFKEEVDEDEEMARHLKSSLNVINSLPKYDENVKGVPDFWLTIFRHTDLLSDMVQPHDEPILKKLQDIKIKYDEDLSYTLEFHFAPNDHFTDTVLTKKYYLRCKIDGTEPFAFEGPEIYKCTGCNINWKPGQNITVKTIKKKQKHKARGAVRTVTKQVPNDSFFNFFNPPEVPEDESKIDEDSQNILGTDFEIGHFLRARIIPRAVLYYTGDVVDDDDDMEEEEEEEEEAEEEEEDENEEMEEPANNKGGYKKQLGGGKKKLPEATNPAECQQQ
jgi:nucleosome assembly protein 1-like 1